MKILRSACELQPNALEINVGEQIEKLDQLINQANLDSSEIYKILRKRLFQKIFLI